MEAWCPQLHLDWFAITRKQFDDVEAKFFVQGLSQTLSISGSKSERLGETLEQSPRDFYDIGFDRRWIRKCHRPKLLANQG